MSKISDVVLGVLSSGEIDGNVFRLNCGQLERKIYTAVNEVLENIGGKWNRKLGGHVFESDPTDKLEEVILTGETINEKQLYQFFETPDHLAKRMVEIADIKENMTVLEPSAGHGAILKHLKTTEGLISCVEIDPKKCEKLFGICGCVCVVGDYLKTDTTGRFDRIVMNPPFTKQQDVDHVLKAWDDLAEGGKIVSIMSPGFTFRQNKKSVEFRNLVEENGWWEELPEETFKESGTMVRTVLVVLDK